MSLIRLAISVLGLMIYASSSLAQLQDGSHIALIIGSDTYQNAPNLTQSVSDATEVADRFQNLGYKVVLLTNPTQRETLETLAVVKLAAQNAQQVVVYLSGHGIQRAGASYYLTIDSAPPSGAGDMPGIPVSLFLKAFSDIPRHKVVLFDACRTPDGFQNLQSPTATVNGKSHHAGSLVAFAAGPGQAAYEGQGPHSPFARALLEQMQHPEQPIMDMLRKIRLSVIRDTQGQQVPWVHSSLLSEVTFGVPRPY